MYSFRIFLLNVEFYLHPKILIVEKIRDEIMFDAMIVDIIEPEIVIKNLKKNIEEEQLFNCDTLIFETSWYQDVKNESYKKVMMKEIRENLSKLNVDFEVEKYDVLNTYYNTYKFIINNFMTRTEKEFAILIEIFAEIIHDIQHMLDMSYQTKNKIQYILDNLYCKTKYNTLQEQFQIQPHFFTQHWLSLGSSEEKTENARHKLKYIKTQLQSLGYYAYIRNTYDNVLMGYHTEEMPSIWNYEYKDLYTKDFGFTLPINNPDFSIDKMIDIIKKTHDDTIKFYQKVQDGIIYVNPESITSGYIFNLYNLHNFLF